MTSGKNNRYGNSTNPRGYLLVLVLSLSYFAGNAWSQVGGSITGEVKDPAGDAIAGATITARNMDTGLTRTAESNDRGNYLILPLPVGSYEVRAEKAGFKKFLQRGIALAAAGQVVVNPTLEVGSLEQQITVEAETLMVNTTLAPTADLVTQAQVKDLPLNGRDWAGLLTLNPNVTNTSSTQSTSAATVGAPTFSVAGKRFEENRFLLNGIDYVGSDMQGENPQPFGASGKLLGVDGIREFNLVTDTYGAEYGKRAGGQILIVTTSGTNALHGDAFEFLRNNIFDSRNFFDPAVNLAGTPIGAPPFKQNQFGGSLGGPLKKDKMFLFGNYEGFRERVGVTTDPTVPDLSVRANLAVPDPCTGVYSVIPGTKPGMLPIVQSYWVTPTPSSVELTLPAPAGCPNAGQPEPTGLVKVPGNPSQVINENFGMVRFDYTLSPSDALNSNYLMDDGQSTLPGRNPVSAAVIPQRAQLASLQETHTFSANLVNVLNFGLSRAWQQQSNVPYSTFPAGADFASGGALGSGYPGKITVGASTSVNSGSNFVTGTINAFATLQHRTFTTGSDDLHYLHGSHSLSFGVWVQRVNNNYNGGSPTGQVAYNQGDFTKKQAGNAKAFQPVLYNLVIDNPKRFTDTPNPTALGIRITQAAWYVQDEIRLKHNLTFRIGTRYEMTSGVNEQNCRLSAYYIAGGIPQTIPVVGCSALLNNKALALWEPRAGIAWDPTGKGTWSIRAGAGMYRDLQDSVLGLLTGAWPNNASFLLSKSSGIAGGILGDSTHPPIIPFNIETASVSPAPPCTTTTGGVNAPAGCKIYGMVGIDPNFQTPTSAEWSFTVEHKLTKDLGIRIGYVGSESYHGQIAIPLNVIPSQVCAATGGCFTSDGNGGIGGMAPQGAIYTPPCSFNTGDPATCTSGTVLNPLLTAGSGLNMYNANADYHGGSISITKQSAHGLTVKAGYTMSKVLEVAAEQNGGPNDPGVLDPYRLNLTRGVAAFSVLHAFTGNFTYELPFGKGKRFGGSANGIEDQVIGGWQWNGIVTALSGFPFTPIAGQNSQNNGDGSGNDVALRNPAFTGSVYLDPKTNASQQWFNPQAFTTPPPGQYGNVARGSYIGPGLVSVDTSFLKSFKMTERFNLQFRTEVFNIANHTNFSVPNQTSGTLSQTATKSRQIQFALKLNF